MASIFKAQYGLNEEGFFIEDPWYLVENNKVVKHGAGAFPLDYTVKTLPEGVVIPGFINSHTHLELSLVAQNPHEKFSNVHEFAQYLMKNSISNLNDSLFWAEKLLQKAVSQGTFYFADISNQPEFSKKIQNISGFSGERFLELLGFSSPNDLKRIKSASEVLHNGRVFVTPHSVYGSSPEIMKFTSQNNEKFISIHLLEESAETGIFSETGITWEFLKKINQSIRHPEIYQNNIIDYLAGYFSNTRKLLFVHLLANDDDLLKKIERIFPQSAIVICHRSNKFLGYQRRNGETLERLKIPLLLGTDSAATAGDVSIINEVADLVQDDIFPENQVWKAATFNAYKYFEISDIPWYFYPGVKPEAGEIKKINPVFLKGISKN